MSYRSTLTGIMQQHLLPASYGRMQCTSVRQGVHRVHQCVVCAIVGPGARLSPADSNPPHCPTFVPHPSSSAAISLLSIPWLINKSASRSHLQAKALLLLQWLQHRRGSARPPLRPQLEISWGRLVRRACPGPNTSVLSPDMAQER